MRGVRLSPAFRNVFTSTWVAAAFQDTQPILLSPEPARQAQHSWGVTCSHPSLAGSWWGAGPGASGQPCATALLWACCPAQGTAVVVSSQGSQKLPGAPKHSPKPWEGGGTWQQFYRHDVSPVRGTEIPLHSSHCAARHPSHLATFCQLPGYVSCVGRTEPGESPFLWIVSELNMLF